MHEPELPEKLQAKIRVRITTAEKDELYRLAGKRQASKWIRWGLQQALKQLREQVKNSDDTDN